MTLRIRQKKLDMDESYTSPLNKYTDISGSTLGEVNKLQLNHLKPTCRSAPMYSDVGPECKGNFWLSFWYQAEIDATYSPEILP